jgi:hypothetical protein
MKLDTPATQSRREAAFVAQLAEKVTEKLGRIVTPDKKLKLATLSIEIPENRRMAQFLLTPRRQSVTRLPSR